MRIDSVNNEEGRHYVQTWVAGLRALLGWSEAETMRWAKRWEKGLNGIEAGFYNETPGWYLSSLLISDSIKEGLTGTELTLLKETLMCIIEGQDSHCYGRSDFDWHMVKQRVAKFLEGVAKEKRRSKNGLEAFFAKCQKRVMRQKPPGILKEYLRKTYEE